MLKRKQFFGASLLLSYASMVRIFPIIFLFGPAVVAIREMLLYRRLTWVRSLTLGFTAGVLLCFLLGSLTGRGIQAWKEFALNINKHKNTILTNNVGLQNLLLYDLETYKRSKLDWSMGNSIINKWRMAKSQVEKKL